LWSGGLRSDIWKWKGTYVAANADAETANWADDIADGAVGGSDNGVGIQEGTAAEVRSASLERDDEGELAGSSGGSANNVFNRNGIIGEGVVGVLRSGRRKDECGKRNSDEGCEAHGQNGSN
jgi:hypothetical protein